MNSSAKAGSNATSKGVAIVSRSRETLDGLQLYLHAAGIRVASTRHLPDVAALAPDSFAVVLFPDDYEWPAVRSALAALLVANAQSRVVVVTRSPHRFEQIAGSQALPELVVVVKPAWSWAILDAVRSASHPVLAREQT